MKYNDNLVAECIRQDEVVVTRHRHLALIAGTDEFRQLKVIHRRTINGARTATEQQSP